jgi:hypothetical protein
MVYITCYEREKKEKNQTTPGYNLTTVSSYAPLQMEEDTVAHLGRQ